MNNDVTKITKDDFSTFRYELMKLLKYLADNPGKRVILSAQRHLEKSPRVQIEYTADVIDAANLHFFNLEELAKNGGFVVPVAADGPAIPEDRDPTVQKA